MYTFVKSLRIVEIKHYSNYVAMIINTLYIDPHLTKMHSFNPNVG